MTDPATTTLRGTQSVEDFTLANAKYPEEIWDMALEVLTESLHREAAKKDRAAFNLRERRQRYQVIPTDDGGYRRVPCHEDAPQGEGWWLILTADTRPLDTVASSD